MWDPFCKCDTHFFISCVYDLKPCEKNCLSGWSKFLNFCVKCPLIGWHLRQNVTMSNMFRLWKIFKDPEYLKSIFTSEMQKQHFRLLFLFWRTESNLTVANFGPRALLWAACTKPVCGSLNQTQRLKFTERNDWWNCTKMLMSGN